MAIVYLLLVAGALTTLYPFLVMVSTGLKGPTDQNDRRLSPRYLHEIGALSADDLPDPAALHGKYLDDKYAGNASLIASTRIGGASSREAVDAYVRLLEDLPPALWQAGFRTPANHVTSRLTMRYQAWLRGRFRTIDDLNRAYIEENVAFQTVSPPNELLDRPGWRPPPGRKWEDWLVFKATLPAEFRLPIRVQRVWQEFLRGRYQGNLDKVPPSLRGKAAAFEEIALAAPSPDPDVRTFYATGLPEALRRDSVEARWRRDEPLPIAAHEAQVVRERAGELRWEFATRNFRFIADYVAINGRALWNTLVFCLLAVLVQLVVNPVAAYALSRYPIRASAKILIFLLATMAFPAEVAMIPQFLLLRDLGLLNTFAALVLPAAASGYMIFLLKGFFDSLPQELFESGQIDGARESTMMLRIALPLSKPVLGYLALLAFMGAYGAFLFAFLVAQDQRMWTLMVWLYQLQLTAPKAVIMAGLAMAALPTLVVFLLAQRVIMRGIVLPGER
jgi:multiple sugar transport system permease protein